MSAQRRILDQNRVENRENNISTVQLGRACWVVHDDGYNTGAEISRIIFTLLNQYCPKKKEK